MKRLLKVLAIPVFVLILVIFFFGPAFGHGPELFLAKLEQVREIATPPANLLAAEARWTANPIRHYRLKVNHFMSTYPFVDCSQEVEVLDEKVIQTFEDGCSANNYLQTFPPLGSTVTELFAKFRKETTTLRFRERDNPGCGWFLGMEISYTSEGYPETAKYDWYEV